MKYMAAIYGCYSTCEDKMHILPSTNRLPVPNIARVRQGLSHFKLTRTYKGGARHPIAGYAQLHILHIHFKSLKQVLQYSY